MEDVNGAILSLMAAFCSAKDNKPPDTKVTAFILMATTHIFIPVDYVSYVNATTSVFSLKGKCSKFRNDIRRYDYFQKKIDQYFKERKIIFSFKIIKSGRIKET